MYFIGIDCGLSGAVMAISDKGKFLTYFDCPTIKDIKGKKTKNEYLESQMAFQLEEILKEYGMDNCTVWIEKIHAMPKQGVSSMFKMGEGYGLWKGIVAAYKLPRHYVTPQAWGKVLFAGMSGSDTKSKSIRRCQELFPEIPLTRPTGKVLSMNGRSDAALIAYYGYREYLSERGR